jgi:hypothetical protein
MPIQPANPFGAYLEGRQARQQEEYGNTRNALARMELESAPQEMQQRNRLADLQIKGLESQYSQDQIEQSLKKTAAAASRLAQSSNPRAEAQVHGEFLAKLREQNPEIDQYDDEQFRQYMGWIAGEAQAKLGIAPAAPAQMTPYQKAQIDLERDKMNQPKAISPYEQARLDIERQKLNKPDKQDSGPLVQVAGPDGNPVYATREEAKGKPAYVARDKPAAADLKYQREIKSKQPRLKAARRRVDRLTEAITSISKNPLFDGGPVDQYALAWTNQGQEVSQSKAALLSELTALTRVPGIGSQSDLETRLASLPFPSAEFSPEVNAKAAAEIQAFVADLEDAYGSVEAEFKDGASSGQPRQSGEVRVSSPQEAMALPPGTVFITPDGRRKVR